MKFSIKTLGCKVNQYEEQVIRENLNSMGFSETDPSLADLFILNSCTVTGQADIKTRKLLKTIKKNNPGIKVFVTGCYAVLEKDIRTLEAMPEVDRVISGNDKAKLPLEICSDLDVKCGGVDLKNSVSGFDSHTRAFIKIQDGCDQRCAYCKVNIVRGPSTSRGVDDILEEVGRLAARGYKEMVLTGICLGSWKGPGDKDLAGLLKEIEAIEGDFRIRLSSIEPNHIDDGLIKVISSSPRFCSHFHIPLQSGSDSMLKAMRRGYNRAIFEGLVRRIRAKMPLAGITMDVIVGFPGETDQDFSLTMDFIRKIRPSRLHVFKYSDREGTPSFGMSGKVPSFVAKERVLRLIQEGEELKRAFCLDFIGKEVDVLVEGFSSSGVQEGYSGEYARVRLEGFDKYEGQIIRVSVDEIDADRIELIASFGK